MSIIASTCRSIKLSVSKPMLCMILIHKLSLQVTITNKPTKNSITESTLLISVVFCVCVSRQPLAKLEIPQATQSLYLPHVAIRSTVATFPGISYESFSAEPDSSIVGALYHYLQLPPPIISPFTPGQYLNGTVLIILSLFMDTCSLATFKQHVSVWSVSYSY